MDEGPAADQPHSMATTEAQDLQGEEDGGSAAKVAQNADGRQVETATIDFGGKGEDDATFFVSSNGLPSENILKPPTTMEIYNASQSMLSTSDLPADETTSLNENSTRGEESVLGGQDGQIPRMTADQSKLENDGTSTQEESAVQKEGEGGAGGNEDGESLDILGNGLLMKKTLRPGDGLSSRPTPQSRVKMKTKGVLDEGGQVVDRHSGVRFTVGDGDVIQAWDLAASLMERGERAQVKTDSRFAHGEIGKPPNIPPNAAITYELELLEVLPPVDYQTITEEELVPLLDLKRVRGNQLFQWKQYDPAIVSYTKGLQMMQNYLEEQNLEPSPKIQNLRLRCWNNLAATYLKANLFKEALESCQAVLKQDPDNVKALFRAGKVYTVRGDYDTAIRQLQKAAALDPEEKAIQTELQRALRKQEKSREDERAMYRRMVEGGLGTAPRQRATSRQQEWGPLPYLAVAAVVAAVGISIAYYITQRH